MKAASRQPSRAAATPRAGRRPRPSPAVDAFTVGLRRRLRKVLSFLPAVRTGEDPDAVHDLRVWSRRLQQALDAAFPKPRPRRAKKARRRLRNVRRALGGWRDLDVVLAEVTARHESARDPAHRRAWSLVAGELRREREREIARAREVIGGLAPRSLGRLVGRLIEEARGPSPRTLRPAVGQALHTWEAALATARTTRRREDLHAMRIATKRLRYRAELSRDLGDPPPGDTVGWAKGLQDRLGRWHDRAVLRDRIAAALARPEIVLREPDALRAALFDLERDAAEEAADIDDILRAADDRTVPAALRSWIAS